MTHSSVQKTNLPGAAKGHCAVKVTPLHSDCVQPANGDRLCHRAGRREPWHKQAYSEVKGHLWDSVLLLGLWVSGALSPGFWNKQMHARDGLTKRPPQGKFLHVPIKPSKC